MNGTQDFTDLHQLLQRLERAGIAKTSQLRQFVFLVENEGRSMSEVAGGSRTKAYSQVLNAMIEVGKGRADKEGSGPNLVTTVPAKSGDNRQRTIKVTPKGKRVFKHLCRYIERVRKT